MDWGTIITGLVGIFCTGGVVYLIADKKIRSDEEKAKAKQMRVETAEQALPLYHEIREIVKAEVNPLKEELEYLKTHYCCYRDNCEMRLPYKIEDNDESTNTDRD